MQDHKNREKVQNGDFLGEFGKSVESLESNRNKSKI